MSDEECIHEWWEFPTSGETKRLQLRETCADCGLPLFDYLKDYLRQEEKENGYFEIPGGMAGFLLRKIEALEDLVS